MSDNLSPSNHILNISHIMGKNRMNFSLFSLFSCAVQSFKPLLKFLEALRYTIETSQNDSLHYLKFNVSDVLKCFKDT